MHHSHKKGGTPQCRPSPLYLSATRFLLSLLVHFQQFYLFFVVRYSSYSLPVKSYNELIVWLGV